MTFRHGVYTNEKSTSMIAPITADASIPVVVGTSPINLTEEYLVNKPVLCFNYGEAVEKLGFSHDFDNYTISESVYSQFALFGVGPAIYINVLDPDIHKDEKQSTINFINGEAKVKQEGILKETVKLTEIKDEEGQSIQSGFELTFDDNGHLNVFMENENVTEAELKYSILDPSAVTEADIIGGVSQNGDYKGLELVNHVFPLFGLVPGTIIVPKYSGDSLVAAVMDAKSTNINGVFKAVSIPDISTETVKDYTEVSQRKSEDNITSSYQFATWPKVSLDGKAMHLSTQMAGLMSLIDSQNEGIPFVSPSNENLKMDSAVLADGKPVVLGVDQANYLNGQGVVTTLNFIGGHRLWGNRTATYPSNSDAKDAFIPLRRMFNYVSNTLVLTYWNKVDDPGNPKLIETVLRSVNTWLDGLTAEGRLLGGRVEFRTELNPKTELLDGRYKFSVFLTPPPPAEEIQFELELDVNYFDALFVS